MNKLENTRKQAAKYINKGYKVAPVKHGLKYPTIKSWQNLDIKIDEINKYFKDDLSNICLLTDDDHFVIDLDLAVKDYDNDFKYPWGNDEWDILSKDDLCIFFSF